MVALLDLLALLGVHRIYYFVGSVGVHRIYYFVGSVGRGQPPHAFEVQFIVRFS